MISQGELFDYTHIDFESLCARFAPPKTHRVGLSDRCVSCILPPPTVRTWDWICENVYTPEGVPFNPLDYAYCEGVCDEWDNPRRHKIVLQWSARVGKTLLSLSLMIASIARDPSNAMFGTAIEKLCKETLADKYYPMFAKCPVTADWVAPENRRVTTRVDLRYTRIYGAWSGSVATLADKDPKFKHANEIDKWTEDASEEADSYDLFTERGAERPDRKEVAECTPTREGRSRINRLLVQGTDCRNHVPCPVCGGHQQLVMGSGKPRDKPRGGVIWDHYKDGETSVALAETTARYRCGICLQEWGDEHRKPAVRRGIWVPNGCYVTDKGKLSGSPLNDGGIASFQLSRLYAPTFSFGALAGKLVEAEQDKRGKAMQNFDNSWLGVCNKPRRVDCEWTEIAARMAVPVGFGIVPNWAAWLTLGVDVQVDHFVFAVVAWGPQGRGHLVDYDICDSWGELGKVLKYPYPYEDGTASGIVQALADARDGSRNAEVIEHCRQLHNPPKQRFFPALGERSDRMGGKMYRRMEPADRDRSRRGESRSRRRSKFTQIMMNKGWYETWIHNCLFTRGPQDPHSLTISGEVADDADLFEQLLSVRPHDKADRSGHFIREWQIIDEHVPRDFRDAIRLARCAGDIQCRGIWRRVKRRVA